MTKINLYVKYGRLANAGYEMISISDVKSDIYNSMTPNQRVKAINKLNKED